MKQKLVVVILAVWCLCFLGGSVWEKSVQHWFPAGSESERQLQLARNLYGAQLYREASAECQKAKLLKLPDELQARFMYIDWASRRNLGDMSGADQLRDEFLLYFPRNPLASDLLFSQAMDEMSAGDYGKADTLLDSIQQQFPGLPICARVVDYRERLARIFQTNRNLKEEAGASSR